VPGTRSPEVGSPASGHRPGRRTSPPMRAAFAATRPRPRHARASRRAPPSTSPPAK
jgi:hypothetical protein